MNTNESLNITAHGDRALHITRVFDAPRELVYEAMTRPDLLERWLTGPPGWTMTACENDLRVGGTFRHTWRGEDGAEMSMSGKYREVAPPERIVRTETFDTGCTPQSGEQVATLTLTEEGPGVTSLRIELLYPSAEARDALLQSGMEQGMAASYATLDEVLAELARA